MELAKVTLRDKLRSRSLFGSDTDFRKEARSYFREKAEGFIL